MIEGEQKPLNWSDLAHMVGDMHDDHELEPVLIRTPDGKHWWVQAIAMNGGPELVAIPKPEEEKK